MFRMLCFRSMIARSSSIVKLTCECNVDRLRGESTDHIATRTSKHMIWSADVDAKTVGGRTMATSHEEKETDRAARRICRYFGTKNKKFVGLWLRLQIFTTTEKQKKVFVLHS